MSPRRQRARKNRRSFVLLAWGYALILIVGGIVTGLLAYGTFKRNVERQMEQRITGHAQLLARHFEVDTLERLLKVKNSEDELVKFVYPWTLDAAKSAGVRRVVFMQDTGAVAIDSSDINNRGAIDYSLRIDRNEIEAVVNSGRAGSTILYEIEEDGETHMYKTSYAHVPRSPDTRSEKNFVVAVEIPVDYPRRLERLGRTVSIFVVCFSAFLALCTFGATRYFSKLQDRIEEQSRKAELAEFSAAIAHEIKNPLGALLTGIQLLQRDLDDKQLNLSGKLEREVRLLDRIVKDFLDFARGAQRNPEPTTTGAIIAQVREQLTRTQTEVLEVQGDMSLELVIDKVALVQAVANLVKNACKATIDYADDPKVTIEVAQAGRNLTYTVRDNGSGIPTELRMHLFEPFVSGHVDGTGLGLAITRRLIEDLGGSVELVSTSSTGTTFKVSVKHLK